MKNIFLILIPAFVCVVFLVTGTNAGACRYDITKDGSVDVQDLARLLSSWGPQLFPVVVDFNADDSVGISDLATLLAKWGLDPECCFTEDCLQDPRNNLCNSGVCISERCVFTEVSCEGNPCATYTCNPTLGCQFQANVPDGTPCVDGRADTSAAQCQQGVCTPTGSICDQIVPGSATQFLEGEVDPFQAPSNGAVARSVNVEEAALIQDDGTVVRVVTTCLVQEATGFDYFGRVRLLVDVSTGVNVVLQVEELDKKKKQQQQQQQHSRKDLVEKQAVGPQPRKVVVVMVTIDGVSTAGRKSEADIDVFFSQLFVPRAEEVTLGRLPFQYERLAVTISRPSSCGFLSSRSEWHGQCLYFSMRDIMSALNFFQRDHELFVAVFDDAFWGDGPIHRWGGFRGGRRVVWTAQKYLFLPRLIHHLWYATRDLWDLNRVPGKSNAIAESQPGERFLDWMGSEVWRAYGDRSSQLGYGSFHVGLTAPILHHLGILLPAEIITVTEQDLPATVQLRTLYHHLSGQKLLLLNIAGRTYSLSHRGQTQQDRTAEIRQRFFDYGYNYLQVSSGPGTRGNTFLHRVVAPGEHWYDPTGLVKVTFVQFVETWVIEVSIEIDPVGPDLDFDGLVTTDRNPEQYNPRDSGYPSCPTQELESISIDTDGDSIPDCLDQHPRDPLNRLPEGETAAPTAVMTEAPTPVPTVPTAAPTEAPTSAPTPGPTPSESPTPGPTPGPTYSPTPGPTVSSPTPGPTTSSPGNCPSAVFDKVFSNVNQNNDWSDPVNWVPQGVPQTGQSVLIRGSLAVTFSGPSVALNHLEGSLYVDGDLTVTTGCFQQVHLVSSSSRLTVTQDATIEFILHSGGTFDGVGNLTIDVYEFSSQPGDRYRYLDGQGTLEISTFRLYSNFASNNFLIYLRRDIISNGVVEMKVGSETDGAIHFSAPYTWTYGAQATVSVEPGFLWAAGEIVNYGKVSFAGVFDSQLFVFNLGTLEVHDEFHLRSGALFMRDGGSVIGSGSVHIQTASSLIALEGTSTILPHVCLYGSGNLHANNQATLNLNTVDHFGGEVGGVDASGTIINVAQWYNFTEGPVNNHRYMTGVGQFNCPELVIHAFFANSIYTTTLSRDFQSNGEVFIKAGRGLAGTVIINNDWTIGPTGRMYLSDYISSDFVTNAGKFLILDGYLETAADWDLRFHVLNGGEFVINGELTMQFQSIILLPGATMRADALTLMNGRSLTVEGGLLDVRHVNLHDSATLAVQNGASVTFDTFDHYGGTLDGSSVGSVIVNQWYNLTAGGFISANRYIRGEGIFSVPHLIVHTLWSSVPGYNTYFYRTFQTDGLVTFKLGGGLSGTVNLNNYWTIGLNGVMEFEDGTSVTGSIGPLNNGRMVFAGDHTIACPFSTGRNGIIEVHGTLQIETTQALLLAGTQVTGAGHVVVGQSNSLLFSGLPETGNISFSPDLTVEDTARIEMFGGISVHLQTITQNGGYVGTDGESSSLYVARWYNITRGPVANTRFLDGIGIVSTPLMIIHTRSRSIPGNAVLLRRTMTTDQLVQIRIGLGEGPIILAANWTNTGTLDISGSMAILDHSSPSSLTNAAGAQLLVSGPIGGNTAFFFPLYNYGDLVVDTVTLAVPATSDLSGTITGSGVVNLT